MIALALGALLAAQPPAAEQERPLSLTLERGRWELGAELGAGALDWAYLIFGYPLRGDLRADAHACVGLTDRLEARLLLPAAAYRFGAGPGPQLAVYGGVLAASFLDELFLYQAP